MIPVANPADILLLKLSKNFGWGELHKSPSIDDKTKDIKESLLTVILHSDYKYPEMSLKKSSWIPETCAGSEPVIGIDTFTSTGGADIQPLP